MRTARPPVFRVLLVPGADTHFFYPFTFCLEKGHKGGQKLKATAGRGLFIALLLFVGIPLPGTGAWTGTLAASLLDMDFKESVLACLVKLYPTLKPAPYCHELVLCTGERCGKKDSLEILHAVKKRLKPGKNGISADQTTLLVTRNCLKHCSTSPNLLLDGVLHTHMTKEKTLSLVEKILEEKGENT